MGDGVAEAVAFGPVFGSARGIPLLDEGEHFGGSGSSLRLELEHGVQAFPFGERGDGVERVSLGVEQPICFAKPVEQTAHCPRDVEIIVEALEEPLHKRGGRRRARRSRRGGGGGFAFESFHERVNPCECGARGIETGQGEVERESVVNGEEGVPDFPAGVPFAEQIPEGVKVSERLAHLLAFHHQMGAVQPIPDERFACATFRLGDFGFVMREDVVNATAMDVELVTEDGSRHCATLNVPTRATPSPRAFPSDVSVLFVPRLPEREVSERFLFELVRLDATARAEFIEIEVSEASVVFEPSDSKIHRAVLCEVGLTLLLKLRNHRNHSRDVSGVGRFGKMLGAFNPECVEIFEEGLFEASGKGRQRDACFAATADGLVVDIGEVHDALDVEAAGFEMPLKEILEDVGAKVPDMGEVIDGGSAGVEANGPAFGIERGEGLERARQRVEEAQRHGSGRFDGMVRRYRGGELRQRRALRCLHRVRGTPCVRWWWP